MLVFSVSCPPPDWTACVLCSGELKKIRKHRKEVRDTGGPVLPSPDGQLRKLFPGGNFPGDSTSHLTHQEHVHRGTEVAKVPKIPEPPRREAEFDWGCSGLCVFAQLPYVDLQHLFVVPWAHAGLLGATKDLVCMIVDGAGSPQVPVPVRQGERPKFVPKYKMSTSNKNIVKAKAGDITCTCDIGRAHRCVITKKGNNTMEDWLHFLEWGCLSAFDGEFLPHTHGLLLTAGHPAGCCSGVDCNTLGRRLTG
jgi:hypothetical protein